jgi:cell wall-associated NlpC family hydrolase
VSSKQAEAQRVLGEIRQIDRNLEGVIQAYDTAQTKLEAIVAEQKANLRNLRIAKANFARAQAQLSQRLLELYTSDNQSALEVLLGSTNLADLLDRIDTVNRVSDQDARIIREVISFRAEIKRREAQLKQAREAQEKIVAQKAAEKRTIQAKLAERQRLLSSIKSEIARLQAAEAARQRQLATAAQARLSDGSVPTTPTPVGNPPSSHYGGVVGIAMQYLGVPYRWGGSSPSTGFDCSGFTMFVFAQVGVSLPHSSYAQFGMGSPVSRADLQPGDLVFFAGASHVGIYIGGGQFIHAPHTGSVVSISSLSGWYSAEFAGGRRL